MKELKTYSIYSSHIFFGERVPRLGEKVKHVLYIYFGERVPRLGERVKHVLYIFFSYILQ